MPWATRSLVAAMAAATAEEALLVAETQAGKGARGAAEEVLPLVTVGAAIAAEVRGPAEAAAVRGPLQIKAGADDHFTWCRVIR